MLDFTEPAVIQDIFASGMAFAEDLHDGNVRFTFYSRQKSTYDGIGYDNVIVCRIVMPVSAVGTAIDLTRAEVGIGCDGLVQAVAMH